MSKTNTKATINANIYANHEGLIRGDILNAILNAMVDDYGEQDKLTEVERNTVGISTETIESEDDVISIETAEGNEVVRIQDDDVSVNGSIKKNGHEVATEVDLESKQDVIEEVSFEDTMDTEGYLSISTNEGDELTRIDGSIVEDEDDAQSWCNDDCTEEYARVDKNGVKAKAYFDGDGQPVFAKIDTDIVSPKFVYCQYNDVPNAKNYALSLFADHFVNLSQPCDVLFSEGLDKLTKFFGNLSLDGSVKNDGVIKSETTINGIISGGIKSKSFTCKKRSILNSATANTAIRALFIGDSVTNGTGANYPTSYTNGKYMTYWAYMAMMCQADKANNGSGFDFISIGRVENTRTEIGGKYFRCEGRGGWSTNDYLHVLNGVNGYTNYFYANKTWQDSDLNDADVKFSLKSYLDKYKTLADDGMTRLVVGSTAGSEVTDVNAWDVCTPNVVVIQLGFNDVADDYKTNIRLMIKAIREEYPNMPIIISMIDAAGTYNPKLYPNIDHDSSYMLGDGLHAKMFGLVSFGQSLPDEFNNLYFCDNYFIQPTGLAVSTRQIERPEAMIGFEDSDFGVEFGAGPNYHPSTFAHSNWGYHLLSMIKWILN